MAYMQSGRNALRKIITDTSLQSSDRMVNPLLYASQGLRYKKLEVILATVSRRIYGFFCKVLC